MSVCECVYVCECVSVCVGVCSENVTSGIIRELTQCTLYTQARQHGYHTYLSLWFISSCFLFMFLVTFSRGDL